MEITFYKYQGAGNDFIIIDDRSEQFDRSNTELVAKMCDRRFGIGADGLMLLRNKEGFDFEMVYYNADGNEGSMCGNGGRCIVAFAKSTGVVGDKCYFVAVDGPHEAEMLNHEDNAWVSLKMIDVPDIEKGIGYVFMDTGSPHYVSFNSNNLDNMDLIEEARRIRYNERYSKDGTNVNFIDVKDNVLKIRTYERGVEDETLACGTGVTAAVLTAHITGNVKGNEINVKAKGGDLKVLFERVGNGYENVWLQGPAEFVFKGVVND
jgi:diaminopimelate epimerase